MRSSFIDYSSLEAYNMSIDKLIRENRIDGPHELYLPVRIKFLEKDNGSPSYIEVRIVDLDPFTKSGGMCKCHLFFSPSACLFSAEGGERKSYGGRTAKGNT